MTNKPLLIKINKLNDKILYLTDLPLRKYNVIFRLFQSFCKFIFKLFNQKIPSHFMIFDFSTHSLNRTIILKHIQNDKFKSSYYYICTCLYNILTRNNISIDSNFAIYNEKCMLLYRNQGDSILLNLI